MVRVTCALLALNVSVAAAIASETASSVSIADDPIGDSLRRREYGEARELIDQALPAAAPGEREFLMYRRGLSLLYARQFQDAIDQFGRQLEAFEDGPWANKAVLRTADAHAALKQFEAAERIYAERVRELVGDSRKGRIAGIYLEFAEEYFKPADTLATPDYAKARKFYERALEVEPGEVLRDRILFGQAQCSQKLSEWQVAATQYESYLLVFDQRFREQKKLRHHGEPLPAPAARRGEHDVKARLGLGECLLAMGRQTEARQELQDLLSQVIDVNGRNEPEARRTALSLIAKTHGFPSPPSGESLTLGVQSLETLIRAYPESKESIQAAYDIGAAYGHLGRHDRAIAAYRELIDRTSIRPSDDETREWAERLSQAALFNIGSIYFAQKKHADAIGAWNQYVAKYPTGPLWSAAQQRIMDAEYQIGADAVEEKRNDDARIAWNRFLQKYPLDGRSPLILYRLGELAMKDQKHRKEQGESPDWNQPIGQWQKLVEKFPNTEESGRAQFMIGKLYEEDVPDLDAAIEAYKKVTWSAWATQAQQRIVEMKSTRLTLQTERSFRTDEAPEIRVDVRNIDRLTVKLYRIVMEDYFRKRHHMRGVEELDLLLIDPDETFDVDVKDYARYKPITQEIEIPCEGPGVFAVRVSNENAKATIDDAPPHRLEATTLVIRSDIDVIVKSSRRQVLVFAQNMRTNKPAPDVRVLISDGEKIVLDKATNEDGVCIGKRKQLKNCDRLSVFAESDGHVAGNLLSLAGLGFSTGLQPRGYIHTDRPVYRRGEAVNIRGILREVDDGRYVLPTSPDSEILGWKMDVVDAKGRVLQTQDVTPSEFGTFAAQFRIAEDAPVGGYKIITRRVEGPVFEGEFSVQTYELSKAFLRFDFDERVVLRGQPITGSVVAEYHYGEPVAGKTVEYQMITPSGETHLRSGVTGKGGKIAFEFESTGMPEEGTVAFQARQADLNISASDQVFVAVRAFRAEVAAARSLVLSDEPVELTVKTRDLSDKPIASKMTLTASLRTREKGQWSETQVETKGVETDAKAGVGRVSLRLSKGGTYVLRAEGRDRFEHVVSAETTVVVSDDEDETRLRIFSDRQHYKVGESIDLDVHSRIESATAANRESKTETLLALVTSEGEEIIRYRLVDLAAGHNHLDMPVEHEHFPNFSVGVAVMSGSKFHTASLGFTVERQLQIVMKPDRTTYRPRDEMTLELEVTDQQGKPVQGEIGIVMIDDALLKMYPDPTPKITEFFEKDARRVAEMRTETSCTFSYRADTRDMVNEVLAENRRLEDSNSVVAGALLRPAPHEGMPSPSSAWIGGRSDAILINGDELKDGPAGGGGDRRGFDKAGEALFGGRFIGSSEKRAYSVDEEAASKSGLGGLYNVEDLLHRVPESRGRAINLNELDRKLGRIDLGEVLRTKVDHLNSQYAFLDTARSAGLERALFSTVRSAPPRTYFPEVAYWNPRVVTGADGKATVRVVIPDSSTKWKLIGRGVTRETITGRGEVEVVAKHDFFVEAITPPTFIEGDHGQIRARVHCMTPYTGEIDVSLTFKDGGPTQNRTVDMDGTGIVEVDFDAIETATPGELEFEIKASTRDEVPDAKRPLNDAVARTIPVRPWGMRIETHAAGVARDNEIVEIELPDPEDAYHDVQLTVAVGPSMQRWLIEEALERGDRWELIERSYRGWMVTPPRTHADAASTLLGCLYVADYVRGRAQGGAGTADWELLNSRIAGLIAQLLSAQNDDGGWGWCGKADNSDAWVTSHVAWAIGKARHDGHAVADSAVEKLTAFLHKSFTDAPPGQTELKSIVLHGLAWVDTVEFAHANRLYRNRQSLSNAALGHLALTLARLDRKAIAAELLGVMEHRLQEVRRGNMMCRKLSSDGNSAWMNSELEVTGLALLAQLSIDPQSATVRPMVSYLAATARATGWRPHKARGAVMAAMATYYAGATADEAKYTLEVIVNGKGVRSLKSEDGGSLRIELAADQLQQGQQRVDFAFDGRGEYAYAVTLSGFTKSFPSPRSLRNQVLHVGERYVMPPPKEYRGRVVPAGFSVASRYDWFRNVARNLPVGDVADVYVDFTRYNQSDNSAGDRDYVIVHETIPAGFRLLTESLSGTHLAYDYADHVLTLYYGSQRHLGALAYKMVATAPGTYRMPPTVLSSLYRPEIKHVNKSDRVLTVLPRGKPSRDEYRMTPDELYNLGRWLHDDGEFDSAAEYLTRLLDEEWVIREEPYRESVRMLLNAALKRDDPDGIVNYFEILKEKYPDLVIPFDQIVEIAGAYARTNQPERAYLIHRATADASFARDSAVGLALREEGRFLESIDYLEDLWREYPDTPQVQGIYYALSQALYAKADDPNSVRPRRSVANTDNRRVNKSAIVRETIRLLRRFLTLYPESPIADEASYSLANAYLDLDDYETVVGLSAELCGLFPESKWLDRFRYIQALAYFHIGSFDRAREIADQVAKSSYRDQQGVERPSPNKWLALYIIGQIYHAQNQTAKAIEYYKKVKSRYSDASDAVDYFEHKFVELPEVTIFHPDQDVYREADEWSEHLRNRGRSLDTEKRGRHAEGHALPFVKIDYRNIKAAELQVYRVDLMKLALVEKDLSRITKVNLAGIRPILEKRVELGDGLDYVDKSVRVDLDLGAGRASGDRSDDASGAFLVICRGDHLYSSGLVLITPLALDVQEDLAAQRVRVNVVDAISRDGLRDVHVKVIGSAVQRFVDGDTDLRGVFVADAVSGLPTAIARDSSGHFAFHRRQPTVQLMAENEPRAQQLKSVSRKSQADYRFNLSEDNRSIQMSNDARLNSFLGQQQRGVQVQQAE